MRREGDSRDSGSRCELLVAKAQLQRARGKSHLINRYQTRYSDVPALILIIWRMDLRLPEGVIRNGDIIRKLNNT